MQPHQIYSMIYKLAEFLEMDKKELESMLLAADTIAECGDVDCHELIYKLTARGYLNEKELNYYLDWADKIESKKLMT